MQSFIHYFLHLVFPLFIALFFFNDVWKKAYLVLLVTMLMDLDHLFANPIFEANRCSIDFHPLHSYYVLPIYIGFLFLKRPFNVIGVGCIFHIITDLTDCMMTYKSCKMCLANSPAIELLKFIDNLI